MEVVNDGGTDGSDDFSVAVCVDGFAERSVAGGATVTIVGLVFVDVGLLSG